MANKVTIDVEARFVDNVTDESKTAAKAVEGIGKEAEKAQKKVDNLSKKKASPIFDADNNKFLNKIRKMEDKMAKMGRSKTAAVLDIVDKATVKIGNIMNKAQSFGRKTWQGMLKFKDYDALSTIKKVTSAAENLTKKTWTALVKVKDLALAPIKAIKNALFSIPTLITAVVSAKVVQEAIVKPTKLADQYTSAKIGFSTLLGESAGQSMMDELDLFAKKTPFETSGVIENAQKMLAYGWDVDRILEDMEIIGDAAAATGKMDAGLESIVRALAEIRSKGKLSTQELNQLAGAGIKAKAYLAEGLGYGTSDEGLMKLAEDLEDGAIGANQAIELILQGMKEFDGMMDRSANETVGGLWSQIKDAFEINIFRRWGQGLQDGSKRGFGSVVKLLDEADEGLAKLGDTLYEIGSNISNWVADKFENAIQKIIDITDSYDFKNASLGEKVSMLWKGVVTDPLKEWWENGGQKKTAETAGKIGKWMGEMLTKGLLALFGATDVLKDIDGSDMGGNVAGSFVQGFLQKFDGSAITQAFVDAISNVWNALPWWGKVIVGGYGVGKAASGIGNMVGGISNLIATGKNVIGSAGLWGAGGSGVLGGLSKVGYWSLNHMGTAASASVLGTTGGMAAAGGAGALAMAAGTLKAGKDFYDAYKAHKEGNTVTRNAQLASGGTVLGAMGAGALIGSFLGGPVGTLIGGGIGAVVGWVAGDKIAANMEAARYESEAMKAAVKDTEKSTEELNKEFEKAKWESAAKRFGDIKLSMEEITRLSNQIVWGDDLEVYEKFATATKTAESNLQSMKTSVAETDKWMWKAGLGVKFNQDEREAFMKSFDDYINSAKAFLENKHYEFTTSASLLLDLESEEGKSILESGNAFYMEEQKKLEDAGKELGEALTNALADGIIDANESDVINSAQQKIADITNKINNAKADAEIELIKVKWGGGNLDYESFKNFMETMKTNLETRMQNADEAFELQVANLKLRFPDGGEEYQKQLETLISGYKATVGDVKADVLSVELNMIGEAYQKDLGPDAVSKLQNVINHCVGNNISPVDVKTSDFVNLVGDPDMQNDVAAELQKMLGDVWNQLQLMKVDGELLLQLGVETEDGVDGKVKNAVDSAVPDTVPVSVGVKIEAYVDEINPVSVSPGYLMRARTSSVYTGNLGGGYRGGIFGGDSAMQGFALGGRPDDGMLKGSTRFIRVNEESPEMIIPLSSQRRGRALKLWAKAGNIMGVPGFARGGLTSGGADEGIRFQNYAGSDSDSGRTVQVDIGGITFEITVNGNDPKNITEAIKAQASEIAETIAGVLADSLGAQFENTPVRGGVA